MLQRGARERPATSSSRSGSPSSSHAASRYSPSTSTRPTTSRTGRTARSGTRSSRGCSASTWDGRSGTARCAPTPPPRPNGCSAISTRQIPAAVHPDRPDLRPVAARGSARRARRRVEYHRIGRDLIEELLDAIPTDPVLAAAAAAAPRASSLDVSLPKLADAAFRAPRPESRDARTSQPALDRTPRSTISRDDRMPTQTALTRPGDPPRRRTAAPASDAATCTPSRRRAVRRGRRAVAEPAAPCSGPEQPASACVARRLPRDQPAVAPVRHPRRGRRRPDGRARPERDAHDQPVRRAGRRQELHARDRSSRRPRCPPRRSTSCRSRSPRSSSTTARRWTTSPSSPAWSRRTRTRRRSSDLRDRYGGAPARAGRCRAPRARRPAGAAARGAPGADGPPAEVRFAASCGPSTGGS